MRKWILLPMSSVKKANENEEECPKAKTLSTAIQHLAAA